LFHNLHVIEKNLTEYLWIDINHEFFPIERTFIENGLTVDEVASSEVENVCDLNKHVFINSYEQGACIFVRILSTQ
jgi:hypothetical protein